MQDKLTASRSAGVRGQTVVFLLMALTILAFAFLWNVDLHRIVSAKKLSQNAGDAAALAAARWQGSTLNLVGELNLMHALALSVGDTAAVGAITGMQARLCFAGPMVALAAAQVAAKNNRIYADEGFDALMREHAAQVAQYSLPIGSGAYYPEPYPNAWAEYADMLLAAADDGIAAAPDNARFFGDYGGDHILLDHGFYDAIAGQNWCWFFLHTLYDDAPIRTLLDVYTGPDWWPPLPAPPPSSFSNCEIFGLGLVPLTVELRHIATVERLEIGARQQDLDFSAFNPTNVMYTAETWYLYHGESWRSWTIMHPENDEHFPIVGPVKSEYDTTGADAVVRVTASAERLTPADDGGESRDDILWTAAAKPFGYLVLDDNDETRLRPDAFSLVLPAFRDVRLIPIDASSAPDSGSFDLAWRRHTDEHLPLYLATGQLSGGCWYCTRLATWESPSFRQTGSAWLQEYNHLCTLPGHGGGGSGGGTRRGH